MTLACNCPAYQRSPTTLAPNDELSVNIGVLNASGGLVTIQALRVGAPSMTVTVSHTNTAVGQWSRPAVSVNRAP